MRTYSVCFLLLALVAAVPAHALLAGDVNGDDQVNVQDVQAVINTILGLASSEGADVDYSGKVDVVDVQAMINSILGFEIDADADGLSDRGEINLGTNSGEVDTDRDGVSDGDEARNGTDPADSTDPSPAPIVVGFVLANGAEETTSLTVTLDNTCLNAPTQYMASSSADFAGGTWQDYTEAPSFRLPNVAGTLQAYFKARNTYGESSVVSDAIVHTPGYVFERAWPTIERAWAFSGPLSVDVDTAGNAYVADTYNGLVKKFAPDGTLLTSWGRGGNGHVAPVGIAVDATGNVYVSDLALDLIRKYAPDGTYLRTLTPPEGVLPRVEYYPERLAVDGSGYVYALYPSYHFAYTGPRVVKFTPAGDYLASWDVGVTTPTVYVPTGDIVVDGLGNVYVSEVATNRVKKFTNTGTLLTEWGAKGTGNGEFRYPDGIAVDASGNVYVADSSNQRIQVFTGQGEFLKVWPAANGFTFPSGIALDPSGTLYAVDPFMGAVHRFASDGTQLSSWANGGSQEGQFLYPQCVALDASDNVYVTDNYNCRVQKFAPDGTFLSAWGEKGTGAGQFTEGVRIAVSAAGRVYATNRRSPLIQQFTLDGVFLTEWQAEEPSDVEPYTFRSLAAGSDGSVYISVERSRASEYCQKFLVPGQALFTADGTGGLLGKLSGPRGLAVNSSASIYIAEYSAHRVRILGTDGTSLGALGDGQGSAIGKLQWPSGVAVDSLDQIYVADTGNNRVQKFSSTGALMAVFGERGSEEGMFQEPRNVAVDSVGNVYIADAKNHRIQKFRPNGQQR